MPRTWSDWPEPTAAHAGIPGSVAVVLLDLDRFKAINNSMGHALGDGVLVSVARRLEQVAGDVDLVARFGGDEFLALITDPDGRAEEHAAAFVARVRDALSLPIPVDDAEVFLDASVGVALNTFGADNPDDLLAHAEAAMYQAKLRGGFGAETFDESLRIEVLDRMATEHSLHRALERCELLLHYQPVVEVRGGTTVGVEALIRWDHPDQGLVAPGRFIPVAEESGLIIPIGAWVLEEACHQLRHWQRGTGVGGSVEVNLSARQIDDPGIVATIEEILERTGLPPGHLTLEITESALMRDAAAALVVLRALKGLGVLLAIDDFGTGLFIAQLPAAVPARHPEGRPHVRPGARFRLRWTRDRVRSRQPRPRARAGGRGRGRGDRAAAGDPAVARVRLRPGLPLLPTGARHRTSFSLLLGHHRLTPPTAPAGSRPGQHRDPAAGPPRSTISAARFRHGCRRRVDAGVRPGRGSVIRSDGQGDAWTFWYLEAMDSAGGPPPCTCPPPATT